MSVLHTVSGIARLAGCPESYVRALERRGVLTPAQDSTGRRLYLEIDAETIRAHRASASRPRATT
jgi:DNA-binding transcriptional MerR regulator